MKICGTILVFALPLAALGQAHYTPYTFVTLAGLAGSSGNNDGVGNVARFNNPNGVATDTNGNVYVADTYNHAIRKITMSGAVTTLAGTVGQVGNPEGVAVDAGGNVYVTDSIDNTILKVTPLGSVSTLAGLAYPFGGYADGKGTNALFDMPTGITVDSSGNVYVADQSNNRIRKITSDGTVSTLAGAVRGYADGVGSAAEFNLPRGVAVDTNDNVYVAEYFGQIIRQITPSGVVSTIVGLGSTAFIPLGGYEDGTNQYAQFNFPASVAVDKAGSLYVADNNNSAIRKITHVGTNWIVTTIAGLAGSPGSSDGSGSAARFNGPFGIAVDNDGYVYVADAYNDTIRVGWAGTASVSVRIQPTSQVVQAAANITFNVVAYGQQPLNYQWLFNGNPISGANGATLTLNSVAAGNDGDYSVLVSNPYGSVTSATASLAVLADGANGNTPTPITVPAAPSQPAGVDSLVVITHGFIPITDPPVLPAWVVTMANDIGLNSPANWSATWYDWSGDAWGVEPETCLLKGYFLGTLYGKELSQQHWKNVHLIAHSAGAGLIQGIAEQLKALPNPPTIQMTFLDPYVGALLEFQNIYGDDADWADCYYVEDWTGGYTGGQLTHAFNVDVSWVDPLETPAPYLGLSGGEVALSSHGYPIDFYTESVVNTDPNWSGAGYGYSLSFEKEGNNWNNNFANYPVGNAPLLPNSPPDAVENPNPGIVGLQAIANDEDVLIGDAEYAVSSTAANLIGDAGFVLNSITSVLPLEKSGGVHPLGNTYTNTPAWLAVGVSVTNAVNFVQFDAAFTDTNSAQGLLTVYWNTNQIGMVDERVAATNSQTYRFELPGTVSSGLYTLSFRLDSFANSSSIAVTNVATGFVGMTQPVALGISITNGAPLLQLTAATNFTYLIQSSTDLVNWTPTALLLNTNGTVQFLDSAVINSSARFYRAVLP